MPQKISKQPEVDVGDEDSKRVLAGLKEAEAIIGGTAERQKLKQNDRVALYPWELSDEDVAALEASEAPAESAQFDHEIE